MRNPKLLLLLTTPLFVGCRDSSGPVQPPSFAEVQNVLRADCAACHDVFARQTFSASIDSAALVASGYIDPADAGQSMIILKPRNAVPHGGGYINSFSAEDELLLTAWIARQPILYDSYALHAKRIARADAPVIDGLSNDPVWTQTRNVRFPIQGGWAGSIDLEMRAAYDDEFVYLVLRWPDDAPSEKRQPWMKQNDGTWKAMSAKPTPFPTWSWADYMGGTGHFDAEGPDKLYEDKTAIIWNTYGSSTVAGFDRVGCAILCHDPNNGFRPGTSYNYSDENRAAKKYASAPAEIADMWHWKYVRMNQHSKIDDQFVRYWQPNTGDPSQGGRASDEGSGGYRSNPATNGAPTYRSGTAVTAPPFYILDNEKVPLTSAELNGLPVGAMIANMITSGPSGRRADVDGRGVHDASSSMWTLEIRRKLVTGDPNDVQFDNLAREYVFGVAVFDNAQIEHSYSVTPLRLVFDRP